MWEFFELAAEQVLVYDTIRSLKRTTWRRREDLQLLLSQNPRACFISKFLGIQLKLRVSNFVVAMGRSNFQQFRSSVKARTASRRVQVHVQDLFVSQSAEGIINIGFQLRLNAYRKEATWINNFAPFAAVLLFPMMSSSICFLSAEIFSGHQFGTTYSRSTFQVDVEHTMRSIFYDDYDIISPFCPHITQDFQERLVTNPLITRGLKLSLLKWSTIVLEDHQTQQLVSVISSTR